MNDESQTSPSRTPFPVPRGWDSLVTLPSSKAFREAFPMANEPRRQPWETHFKVNETESAYIKGDDMRLLGGRVNAHSS
ncbi:hypothetical protein ANO14919_071840 [Xylariales sp. No.14919]|nr:hypothetical protein ANO14919_071840 [Xylariales sp. No.14919]